MPYPQAVANPAGAYGLPLAGTNIDGQPVMVNDNLYLEVINNSAGTLLYGDVVVIDVTGQKANTTTTAQDVTVFGVVAQVPVPPGTTGTGAIPAGNPMMVQVRGVARVNVVNTNAIVAGTPLSTNGVAKQATGNVTAITVANAAATFAIALEAFAAAGTRSDAATTIRAKLCLGA